MQFFKRLMIQKLSNISNCSQTSIENFTIRAPWIFSKVENYWKLLCDFLLFRGHNFSKYFPKCGFLLEEKQNRNLFYPQAFLFHQSGISLGLWRQSWMIKKVNWINNIRSVIIFGLFNFFFCYIDVYFK